ncbi:MAG: hypothetical protein VX738_13400 [Planctomycetota bacterium]|nr:hypothetical protein [Planctomycetota bacterium]
MDLRQIMAALFIAAVAGLLLTAITIDYVDLPLWIDELHTSWTIHGEMQDIAQRAAFGNQSPLYFVVLKLLTLIAGHSESVLRSLSITSGIACIVLMTFWAIQKKYDPILILVASVMFASDRLVLLFAVEARPYEFLMFLTIVLFVLQTVEVKHRLLTIGKDIGWTFCAAAMFYTHYTALPILATMMAARWITRPKHSHEHTQVFIIQAFILILCGIPRLTHLFSIYEHRSQWTTFIKSEQATLQALIGIFPVLSLVGVPLVFMLIDKRYHSQNKHVPESDVQRVRAHGILKTTILWALLPMLAAWICTRWNWVHWFFPRYLVAILPAYYLFLVASVSRIQLRRYKYTAVLLCILCWGWQGHSAVSRVRDGTVAHKQENWKAIVQFLNSQTGTGNVLLMSGLIEDRGLSRGIPATHGSMTLHEYCQFPLRGMYRLDRRWNVIPLDSTDLTDATLRPFLIAPRTWVVVRGRTRIEAWEKITRQTFHVQHYQKVKITGNVALFSWRRKP